VDGKHRFGTGEGESRGVECSVAMETARGSRIKLMYAYSVAIKKFKGESFFPNYDQRHKATLIAERSFNKRWFVTGVVNFASGRPANLYDMIYYTPTGVPFSETPDGTEEQGVSYTEFVPVVLRFPKNAFRYPSFVRFDVAVNRKWYFRWGTMTLYLQIINVFNRKNVVYYKDLEVQYARPSSPESTDLAIRCKVHAFYGFPFLPFVGISVKF